MHRDCNLIVVRFHGGFLDGQIVNSEEPLTGGINDYWHPRTLYDTTAGQVGAFMSGVSPEGLNTMKRPSETAPTVVLHHRYRVTACSIEPGVVMLDVAYEYVPDPPTA